LKLKRRPWRRGSWKEILFERDVQDRQSHSDHQRAREYPREIALSLCSGLAQSKRSRSGGKNSNGDLDSGCRSHGGLTINPQRRFLGEVGCGRRIGDRMRSSTTMLDSATMGRGCSANADSHRRCLGFGGESPRTWHAWASGFGGIDCLSMRHRTAPRKGDVICVGYTCHCGQRVPAWFFSNADWWTSTMLIVADGITDRPAPLKESN